ncbi:MAG: cysteine-rich small domain-containing protein [Desulfovibrio sp.]|uniref:cysteine-rich small domain-containing protein n=1 Tax=Desulfovibrio sp. 7SRBS1 TaxID=3378064 RepID=UPI003B3D55EE
MKNNHRYFCNSECEYFPCHKGLDPSEFNCLFCFCPLYFFSDCGGDFSRTKQGVKDCTGCTKPHGPGGYDHVMRRLKLYFQKYKNEQSFK